MNGYGYNEDEDCNNEACTFEEPHPAGFDCTLRAAPPVRFTIWQCRDECCEERAHTDRWWNVATAPGRYESWASFSTALESAARRGRVRTPAPAPARVEPGAVALLPPHRRTDPACPEYRAPRSWWGRERHEAARGKACEACMMERAYGFTPFEDWEIPSARPWVGRPGFGESVRFEFFGRP